MIESIYNDIVHTLWYNGECFMPQRCRSFYKFWWSEELDVLKDNAILSFKTWKANGMPCSGTIYDKYSWISDEQYVGLEQPFVNTNRMKCVTYRTYIAKWDNSSLLWGPYLHNYNVWRLFGWIICDMTRGKAAGLDNLSAEHLQNCHSLLPVVLAKLFNLIELTGYNPSGFRFSYIYTVPIPKNKANLSIPIKALTIEDFRV